MFGVEMRITMAFLVFTLAVRKYGIVAAITGQQMKHAAIGRAKRSRRGTCGHAGAGVGDLLPASILIAQLKESREKVVRRRIPAVACAVGM
jgi:hypothetical protein